MACSASSFVISSVLLICSTLMKIINCSDEFYVAAVVEYSPVKCETPQNTLLNNVNEYQNIINGVRSYNVDIIVFPEAGLTGTGIPKNRTLIKEYALELPSSNIEGAICGVKVACNSLLTKLSYAARRNHLYVVVNLSEIEICSKNTSNVPCPEDGFHLYNTNIVFDRGGIIVSRYRKYNLYAEEGFERTEVADSAFFHTDFRVTFGMITCFDILFKNPSVYLVERMRIKHILFPHAWFSELPFLTASSIQAAWAYTMNVSLLSAGLNRGGGVLKGGSGMFNGRKGPLIVLTPRARNSTVLIASVDKNPNEASSVARFTHILTKGKEEEQEEKESTAAATENSLNFLRDASVQHFQMQSLRFEESGAIITDYLSYTRENFTCNVTVTWRSTKRKGSVRFLHYRMIAYSGERLFSTDFTKYVEVCGIILCEVKSSQRGCHTPSFFYFTNLSVQIISVRVLTRTRNALAIIVPVTLDLAFHPLSPSYYNFSSCLLPQQQGQYSAELALARPSHNIYTFATYRLPS